MDRKCSVCTNILLFQYLVFYHKQNLSYGYLLKYVLNNILILVFSSVISRNELSNEVSLESSYEKSYSCIKIKFIIIYKMRSYEINQVMGNNYS